MAIFCTYCGRVLKEGEICQCRQGNQPDNGQPMGRQNQQPYGQPMGQQAGGQQLYPRNIVVQLSMNWYKFVRYVMLYLVTVCMVIMGIVYVNGQAYEENTELVYYLFNDLKTVDIIYGFVLIILGIWGFIIRKEMALYANKAPKHYIRFLTSIAVLEIIYYIAVYQSTISSFVSAGELGEYMSYSSDVSEGIVGIVLYIIFIILNKMYFDKRIHLFVN